MEAEFEVPLEGLENELLEDDVPLPAVDEEEQGVLGAGTAGAGEEELLQLEEEEERGEDELRDELRALSESAAAVVREADLGEVTTAGVLAQLATRHGQAAVNRHRAQLRALVKTLATDRQMQEQQQQDNNNNNDNDNEEEEEGRRRKKPKKRDNDDDELPQQSRRLKSRRAKKADNDNEGDKELDLDDVLRKAPADEGAADLFAGLQDDDDKAAAGDDELPDAGARDDEDDDDGNYKQSKKKKNREKDKEKEKEKKRSKKKKQMTADEEAVADLKRDAKPVTAVMKVFRDASDALKARVNRGVVEPAHDTIAQEVQVLMQEMQTACESDRDANESGEPAINKLKLKDKVDVMLHKAYLQEPFVENGGLGIICEWLKPLPDGSPCPLGLRLMLLKAVADLRVDWSDGGQLNQLKKSQLGKMVMHLYRTEAQAEVKLMTEKLIELWSRPVFGINDDWKTLAREEEKRVAPMSRRSSQSELAVEAERRQKEIQQLIEQKRKAPYNRARLPLEGESLGAFVARPARRKVDETTARLSKTSRSMIAEKHMQDEIFKTVSLKTKK